MRLLVDSFVDTSPLHPDGPVNQHIHTVYVPIFIVSAIVCVGVSLLILYSALRFRRKHDDEEPEQVHGNTKLEVAWTLIPFVILISLFVLTAANMPFINDQPAGAMKVHVIGQRYSWTFDYVGANLAKPKTLPNGSTQTDVQQITTMYVPVGTPVALDIDSTDVNHSFYVPTLAGQMNAIPGQTNHIWLQADQVGHYYGQCTELCGDGHAGMLLEVVALPLSGKNSYYDWLHCEEAQKTTCAVSGVGGA